MVGLGDTFVFTVKKSHLWVVITAPAGTNGDFVMVNMTSDYGTGEGACVLDPADHPSFIVHQTEMRYKDAREWNLKGFAAAHKQGVVEIRNKTTQQTLGKIQDGCFRSPLFKYFSKVCAHLVNPVVDENDIRVRARRMLGMRYP